MAKNSIRDYSATNSSNTDIQSIDISEGCSPAGINNAIREVMADLKDVSAGTVALESPAADSLTVTGNVGIGTSSPRTLLDLGANGVSHMRWGSWSELGEESSHNSLVIGNNVYVDSSTTKVRATSSDGYRAIKMKFSDGITFHTASGSVTAEDAMVNERMRIDPSGNVTIQPAGTTTRSFGETVAVKKDQSAPTRVSVRNDTNNSSASSGVTLSASGNSWTVECGSSAKNGNALTFALDATAATPSEKMRIDSSGRVGIGVTPSSGYKFTSSSSGTSGLWAGYFHGQDYAKASRLDTSGYADFFYTPTGYAGYIYVNTATNTTTYASSSDYRLKTSIEYDWDATTRLKQLKPTRFKWISAGDDAVPVDGFLAHEVQNVIPEAVVGTKDAMRDEEYEVTPAVEATYDDDGNILTEAVPAVMGTRSVPDYQGIDQSKVVPLLTKALIEAVEKIEALEARITALETA